MIALTAAELALFADDPPDPLEWFRELLRGQLDARAWSQARLALEAEIDPAHLCRVMAGLRGLTRKTTIRIARALDLDERATDQLLLAAGHVPDGIDRETLCRALDLARGGR